MLETSMVSVERVDEYCHVDQEVGPISAIRR